jgi:hypothetical protein
MLRPATPLTVLLLAAFVLLLISVISTPIVKSIPLASYNGVDYGVFGYCTGNKCSKIEIGYNFGRCNFEADVWFQTAKPPTLLPACWNIG